MAAKKSTCLQEAAHDLYVANADYNIRYMAECYEEQQRLERLRREKEQKLLRRLKTKDDALAEKDAALAEKDSALAEKGSSLAAKDAENAALRAELDRLRAQSGQ